MERVGILINKLQAQYTQQADANKLIVTAQMLYAELLKSMENGDGKSNSLVAVTSPYAPPTVNLQSVAPEQTKLDEVELERDVVVEDNEKNIPQQKVAVEEPKEQQAPSKPKDVAGDFVYEAPIIPQPSQWAYNQIDIPTLTQQKVVFELKDTHEEEPTMNDKLKEEKTELGNVLHETPIRDLKKAISVNDRHNFINTLFKGDETMYERSIKTINNFTILAEAEFWIQRELKLKLAWDTNLPEVKTFDHLVRRRFS